MPGEEDGGGEDEGGNEGVGRGELLPGRGDQGFGPGGFDFRGGGEERVVVRVGRFIIIGRRFGGRPGRPPHGSIREESRVWMMICALDVEKVGSSALIPGGKSPGASKLHVTLDLAHSQFAIAVTIIFRVFKESKALQFLHHDN